MPRPRRGEVQLRAVLGENGRSVRGHKTLGYRYGYDQGLVFGVSSQPEKGRFGVRIRIRIGVGVDIEERRRHEEDGWGTPGVDVVEVQQYGGGDNVDDCGYSDAGTFLNLQGQVEEAI